MSIFNTCKIKKLNSYLFVNKSKFLCSRQCTVSPGFFILFIPQHMIYQKLRGLNKSSIIMYKESIQSSGSKRPLMLRRFILCDIGSSIIGPTISFEVPSPCISSCLESFRMAFRVLLSLPIDVGLVLF